MGTGTSAIGPPVDGDAQRDATVAPSTEGAVHAVAETDIQHLARLRAGIRSYLAWAEEQARDLDTTPNQFQLALAIRSSEIASGPTVRDLADMLHLKHHSAVGLIDRAEAAGLVRRHRDADHGARVRITLTPEGIRLFDELAARHVEHLARIAPSMAETWLAFAGRSAERGPDPT